MKSKAIQFKNSEGQTLSGKLEFPFSRPYPEGPALHRLGSQISFSDPDGAHDHERTSRRRLPEIENRVGLVVVAENRVLVLGDDRPGQNKNHGQKACKKFHVTPPCV